MCRSSGFEYNNPKNNSDSIDKVDFSKRGQLQQNNQSRIQGPALNGAQQLPPKHPTLVKPMGSNYSQVALPQGPIPPTDMSTRHLPPASSSDMSYTSTPTPPPMPTPEPQKEDVMIMQRKNPLPPPPPPPPPPPSSSQVAQMSSSLPQPPKQVPAFHDSPNVSIPPAIRPAQANPLLLHQPPPRPPKSNTFTDQRLPAISNEINNSSSIGGPSLPQVPPKASTFKPPPPPPPPPPPMDDDMHYNIKRPASRLGVVGKAQAVLEQDKQKKVVEEKMERERREE